MKHYVTNLETVENPTKVVCDFLAIAERSDAFYIIVAIAIRALDQNTKVEPLTGLNDAMHARWRVRPCSKEIHRVVVSMAP